jgi:phosphohistidine phosphatase
MKVFKVDESDVHLQSQLYLAVPDVFMQSILNIPDSVSSAAIFSHNDGITEFANTLTNTRIDNMPTCSVFAVKTDIANWKDFKKAKKEFWFFDYPKMQP